MTPRFLIASLWITTITIACGGAELDPDAPLPTYEERDVLFVEPDDLHAWIEAGHAEDVVFVDNRNQFVYEESRIQGARLVPTERVRSAIGTLPLNKWLIMYCTWPDDGLSVRAAQLAEEEGLEKVAVLKGGLGAWQRAGYPVASGS